MIESLDTFLLPILGVVIILFFILPRFLPMKNSSLRQRFSLSIKKDLLKIEIESEEKGNKEKKQK